MIEIALEKYPVEMETEDGLRCVIRPMEQRDEDAIREFHLAVPEEERLSIKHRITDRALFHQWCRDIDYELNLPLLILSGEKIIADGTLHQRHAGWKRHIGLFSALVHPDFRGRGLVKVLIAEIVDIARHAGLTRLEAELTGEREGDIRALLAADFDELVRLPDYVQDMHAVNHDYVLLGLNLLQSEKYMGVGD